MLYLTARANKKSVLHLFKYKTYYLFVTSYLVYLKTSLMLQNYRMLLFQNLFKGKIMLRALFYV